MDSSGIVVPYASKLLSSSCGGDLERSQVDSDPEKYDRAVSALARPSRESLSPLLRRRATVAVRPTWRSEWLPMISPTTGTPGTSNCGNLSALHSMAHINMYQIVGSNDVASACLTHNLMV